jgi:serine/threonine protein phosphatase PrpC
MEMFEDIKRPRAEKKVINEIVTLYEEGKKYLGEKKYLDALNNFENAYELLTPIIDVYPKTETLYKLIKVKFKVKHYDQCLITINKLERHLPEIKSRKNDYIRYKIKIFIMKFFIQFINNNLNESVNQILEMIEFIKNDKFDLGDKIFCFWKYLKSFLIVGKITKSTKFEIFRSDYKKMVVRITDEIGEQKTYIRKEMQDIYKNFMTTKMRQNMYDELNKVFYLRKYNRTNDDKIISFLDKFIHIAVRENNDEKLKDNFTTFLILNNIDSNNCFSNMSMTDLIHEQKRRILIFDAAFSNLCGAFNVIFQKYYYVEQRGNLYNNNNNSKFKKTLTSSLGNRQNLAAEAAEIFAQIKKMKQDNDAALKAKRDSLKYLGLPYNFDTDIVVPENPILDESQMPPTPEEIRKTMKSTFLYSGKDRKSIKNKSKKLNKDKSSNSIISASKDNNDSKISEKENNDKKNSILTTIKTTSQSNIIQSMIRKKPKYILRNINNYLLNIIIKEFEGKGSLPRRSDFIDLKIQNYIKSYSILSQKGTQVGDIQDKSFKYENFLLFKNFYCFGVCDGHGKQGHLISERTSIMFPSYLQYIIMEDNLNKRKEDINEATNSLFKLEERPATVKELNIIRYFYKKYDLIYKDIPFNSHDFNELKLQISESLYRTHMSLKEKFKIDTDYSGSTFCSIFFYSKQIYCANVGDSRAILGTFYFDDNLWKTKQLTIDHLPDSPNEQKRIMQFNGRVDRLKNEFGEEVGPYRVFEKANESLLPGLAMSRSIGDSIAKKFGVTYEPDLFEYKLIPQDKIIIIATDGLWHVINNEEAISICAKYFEEKMKPDDACEELINVARERWKNISGSNYNMCFDPNTEVTSGNRKKSKEIDDITCIVIFLDVKE